VKLTFLGTAASEGYPNAFCNCLNCERARQLGGPSLRKRSAVLVNADLLIDLGPDLMAAAQAHGVSLAGLRYCVQTHEHADHLDPSHLASRSSHCGVHGVPRLHLYTTRGGMEKAGSALGLRLPGDGPVELDAGEALNLTFHQIGPFQEFAVGPYHVHSVLATHDPKLTPLLHVVEQAGRSLFYGTDTGPLSEATWAALSTAGHRFNVVVLDHTFGLRERSGGHMNQEQFLETADRLRAEGLLADDARIFAQHFGHHSNPDHSELVALAAKWGYEIPYDGLVVNV